MKNLNLKKIYDSKYTWAILSLILSICLWVYISSVEETVQQNTYSGIPVVFMGEETIRNNRGLIISEVDTTSVRVKITGNRRALGKFNAGDLQAIIDVTSVTQANENSWTYKLSFPSGVDTSGFVYELYPETINFKVEKEASKTVPVQGVFDGSAAEGFIANSDALVFEPSEIVVYGTEEELATIHHAWVTVKGEGISASFTENRPYVLMDENSNELSLKHCSADVQSIATTLTVNTIKEVAVAGGVSANTGLRNAFHDHAKRYGWNIYSPKFSFTTDNAAMIAITGYYKYLDKDFCSIDKPAYSRVTI